MVRGLQLPTLRSLACQALIDLGAAVRELDASGEWLDMLEREYGLIMAMARIAADRQREIKEQVDQETGEVIV